MNPILSLGRRDLFKKPGAKCELSKAVVQFGMYPQFDTLIFLGRYNYRSMPLWSPAKEIARRAGCSERTACRWGWFHDFRKYRTDNPGRKSRRLMRKAA